MSITPLRSALETFTIGFAKEFARDGIRVNCVWPGHIYTDMHADGGEPGRADRVKDTIPDGARGTAGLGRFCHPMARGTEASFVTGTFLDATGGI